MALRFRSDGEDGEVETTLQFPVRLILLRMSQNPFKGFVTSKREKKTVLVSLKKCCFHRSLSHKHQFDVSVFISSDH